MQNGKSLSDSNEHALRKSLSDTDAEALRTYITELFGRHSREVNDTIAHYSTEISAAVVRLLEQLLISSNQIVANNHAQLRAAVDLLQCHSRQQSAEHMERYMMSNDKYLNSKRVTHFGQRYFSMGTEDGIIAEIFNRIGTTDRRFVEIGCNPDGLQNNTLYLLLKQWRGLWIEMDTIIRRSAQTKFNSQIGSGQLVIKNEKITWENVNHVIKSGGLEGEVDFFSLDIDSWEYYVWEALEVISPRVLVVEYQSLFGPEVACTVPKDLNYEFVGSYYAGCSLKALEKLGQTKGYSLVGCDFSGTNAFFVRKDLVGDRFEEPFTTENHYEPNRSFLYQNAGSGLDFGKFTFV